MVYNYSLPHLEKINLSDNELTGTFSTFKSPKIVTFNLSKNNLSGTLPADIGMLVSFRHLIVKSTHIQFIYSDMCVYFFILIISMT